MFSSMFTNYQDIQPKKFSMIKVVLFGSEENKRIFMSQCQETDTGIRFIDGPRRMFSKQNGTLFEIWYGFNDESEITDANAFIYLDLTDDEIDIQESSRDLSSCAAYSLCTGSFGQAKACLENASKFETDKHYYEKLKLFFMITGKMQHFPIELSFLIGDSYTAVSGRKVVTFTPKAEEINTRSLSR